MEFDVDVSNSWSSLAIGYARILILLQFCVLIPAEFAVYLSQLHQTIADTGRISQILLAYKPDLFQSVASAIITLQSCLHAYRQIFRDFPFLLQYLSIQIGSLWNGFTPPSESDFDRGPSNDGCHLELREPDTNAVPAGPKEIESLMFDLPKRILAQKQLLAVLDRFAIMLPTSFQDLWDKLDKDDPTDVDFGADFTRVIGFVSEWMDKFEETVRSIAFYIDEPPDSLLRMDKLLTVGEAKSEYFRSCHPCDFFPTPVFYQSKGEAQIQSDSV
jgi:hypothetical protein